MSMTLTKPAPLAAAFADFQAERTAEPAWLRERRAEAWARCIKQAWPTGREEQWMRTDIRLFKLEKFPLVQGVPTAISVPALLTKNVELGGSMTTINGHCVVEELSAELAAQGVLFGDLNRLCAEQPKLLEKLFAREVIDPTSDKFASLNSACWSGGTLVYIPKNVKVSTPLHALAAMTGGASDFAKTIIVLEEGAEATIIQETASSDANSAGLHCGSIEIVVGRDAQLRYVNLQNWSHGVWHFAHQRAIVEERGQIQWTIGALGSRLAKVNQEVSLDGNDAQAQVNGVMFTQGKQHLCYNTHQHHRAPYCNSDLLYKSALQEDSRTVWRGMIKVDKPAQRTNAYQRNDNLMLSADSRADSIPGLEIEADDVRCTHGSTSGRVDETQIFYAMTRGYTREEAVRMIVAGFFQQVFDRITIDSVRDALGDAIGKRVRNLTGAATPKSRG